MSLKEKIVQVMKKEGRPMEMKEIVQHFPTNEPPTIRARIYENMGVLFKKIARGVYFLQGADTSVLVVEGNGRDLSLIDPESIDAIITDHPWFDPIAHVGRNRNFTDTYETFRYTLEDFKEKSRVLKPGGFLVEFLPMESESNYDYLYLIKKWAEEAGFRYYAKVPWLKGKNGNTGRNTKNFEDIMFFTKGRARSLRPDVQQTKRFGEQRWMSGAAFMLPDWFDFPKASNKERIHQAEKPVPLLEALLEAVTLPGEVVLDQFSGSGNLGRACLNKGRFGILYELLAENVEKIVTNIKSAIRVEDLYATV